MTNTTPSNGIHDDRPGERDPRSHETPGARPTHRAPRLARATRDWIDLSEDKDRAPLADPSPSAAPDSRAEAGGRGGARPIRPRRGAFAGAYRGSSPTARPCSALARRSARPARSSPRSVAATRRSRCTSSAARAGRWPGTISTAPPTTRSSPASARSSRSPTARHRSCRDEARDEWRRRSAGHDRAVTGPPARHSSVFAVQPEPATRRVPLSVGSCLPPLTRAMSEKAGPTRANR